MRKLLILANVTIQTYVAYRVNFVLWRFRSLISLTALYFLWSQAVVNNPQVASYSREQIFSYIFLANFLNAVVLSSRVDQLAGDILNGSIINQLLKPLSIFTTLGVREIVDKLTNVIFSALEIVIFIALVRPTLFMQTDPLALLWFAVFAVMALLISFYISFSLSMIAFWTTEIWAPRFIFLVLISVLAGTLFPLDIFPTAVYQLMLLTPFPYLVYVPAHIFVAGYTPMVWQFLLIGGIWLGATALLSHALWKRGLREFTFLGR